MDKGWRLSMACATLNIMLDSLHSAFTRAQPGWSPTAWYEMPPVVMAVMAACWAGLTVGVLMKGVK